MKAIVIIAPLIALAAYLVLLLKREQLTLSDLRDMLRNRDEYKTPGQTGERFLYRELLELGVPKHQIFRNVYIPVPDKPHKTTEIDLLVVSKKGLLIFEHKSYQGKIYGNGQAQKWTQVYHGKRHFLSPVEQNRYHRKCLQRFLSIKLPIYTFITHSIGGEWHVDNIPPEAHFLNAEGDFRQIYQSLPDTDVIAKHFTSLTHEFAALSRPENGTEEQHIAKFGKSSA